MTHKKSCGLRLHEVKAEVVRSAEIQVHYNCDLHFDLTQLKRPNYAGIVRIWASYYNAQSGQRRI